MLYEGLSSQQWCAHTFCEAAGRAVKTSAPPHNPLRLCTTCVTVIRALATAAMFFFIGCSHWPTSVIRGLRFAAMFSYRPLLLPAQHVARLFVVSGAFV